MLSKETIIRAWTDMEFRNTLSEAEQQALPSHPAGMVELSDSDLATVAGGSNSFWGNCFTSNPNVCYQTLSCNHTPNLPCWS